MCVKHFSPETELCLNGVRGILLPKPETEKLLQKLQILNDYCESHGMVVNESKTKLMVINGDPVDRITIRMGDVDVKHCDQYVYLGAVFTSDGNVSSSIAEQMKMRLHNLNKLKIFFAANYDAPFSVKRKVFEAAFSAAILYGMESWIGGNLEPVEAIYAKGVRAMLGVKKSTQIDICLLEAGLPPVKYRIREAQRKFFSKMINERNNMFDDPFWFTCQLTREYNAPMWQLIEDVLAPPIDFIPQLRTKVTTIGGSRAAMYRLLNPTLVPHSIYKNIELPDSLRTSFSRFRLSSHRLRIETGRWSKLPRDQRVCSCEEIQDEPHVLVCPRNQQILIRYGFVGRNIQELMEIVDKRKLSLLHDLVKNLEK